MVLKKRGNYNSFKLTICSHLRFLRLFSALIFFGKIGSVEPHTVIQYPASGTYQGGSPIMVTLTDSCHISIIVPVLLRFLLPEFFLLVHISCISFICRLAARNISLQGKMGVVKNLL